MRKEDEYGQTALNRAAWNGNEVIERQLLENRASANLKDINGDRVLQTAVGCGDTVLFELLLKHGANTEVSYGN